MSLDVKLRILTESVKNLESAAVAFSAGVDSTFLLKIAHDVLGDNVIALSAVSPLFPKRELKEAVEFCKKEKIKHKIINIDIDIIRNNPEKRCYICKKNIFSNFIKEASFCNIKNILEGSNVDDVSDYRPGMAAIKELGILSPLMEAGLTKKEIRILSENFGLKTFNKPSFACLASRFVYGEKITDNKLKMVEEAEDFLSDIGFNQFRVRIHGNIARIEVLEDDFECIIKNKNLISNEFKKIGFDYCALDLKGYRTGSMNEVLKDR